MARDTGRGGAVALELLSLSQAVDVARIAKHLGSRHSARHPIWRVLDIAYTESQVALVCEYSPVARLSDELDAGSLSASSIYRGALQLARLIRGAHQDNVVFGHLSPIDIWVDRESTKFVPRLWPRPYTKADVELMLQKAPDERIALAPEWLGDTPVGTYTDVFAIAGFASRSLGRFTTGRSVRKLATTLERCVAAAPDERPSLQELISDLERAVATMRASERRTTVTPKGSIVESIPAKDTDSGAAPPPLYLHQNAQFTAYRPKVVVPNTWHTLLVFAHLAERQRDDEPHPVEEVRRQAESILGNTEAHYQVLINDSRQAVPQEGELRLVPVVAGIEFAPAERRFRWVKSVHREEFQLRATAGNVPRTARGRLTVFLGAVILAEIDLAFEVALQVSREHHALSPVSGQKFRSFFASYSRDDKPIVLEFQRFIRACGDQYWWDMDTFRAGERWEPRVRDLIAAADIFQLFWSWKSLESKSVRHEYQYALSLNRDFIRPVYWEDPFPQRGRVPPPRLRQLHFYRIEIARPDSQPTGQTPQTEKTSDQPIIVTDAVAEAKPQPGVESEESDLELLTRAQGGDAIALELLLKRHMPALRRFAHGRLPRAARSSYDESDLVQDVVLWVLPQLSSLTLKSPDAFQRLLRESLANRIRDLYRSRTRSAPAVQENDAPSSATSPLDSAVHQESLERYEIALQRLSPSDREAIIAKVELGLSYEALSLALGKPSAASARMAVARAIGRLLEKMQNRTSTSDSPRTPRIRRRRTRAEDAPQVGSVLAKQKHVLLRRLAHLEVPAASWVVSDPSMQTAVVRRARTRNAWERLAAAGQVALHTQAHNDPDHLSTTSGDSDVWLWVRGQSRETLQAAANLSCVQADRLLLALITRTQTGNTVNDHRWRRAVAHTREDLEGVRTLLTGSTTVARLSTQLVEIDKRGETACVRFKSALDQEHQGHAFASRQHTWWASLIASTV